MIDYLQEFDVVRRQTADCPQSRRSLLPRTGATCCGPSWKSTGGGGMIIDRLDPEKFQAVPGPGNPFQGRHHRYSREQRHGQVEPRAGNLLCPLRRAGTGISADYIVSSLRPRRKSAKSGSTSGSAATTTRSSAHSKKERPSPTMRRSTGTGN